MPASQPACALEWLEGETQRTGSPEDAAWFWNNLFAFIDASFDGEAMPLGIETGNNGDNDSDP